MSGAETAVIIGAFVAAAASTAAAVSAEQSETGGRITVGQRNAQVQQRDLEVQALLNERDAEERQIQIAMEQELLKTDLDALDREEGRFLSSQDAAIAFSGFEPTGSPLAVVGETAAEFQLQRDQVQFDSLNRQRELQSEADLLQFQADDSRRRGVLIRESANFEARVARRASNTRILSQLLSGGASALSAGAGLFGGGGAGGA